MIDKTDASNSNKAWSEEKSAENDCQSKDLWNYDLSAFFTSVIVGYYIIEKSLQVTKQFCSVDKEKCTVVDFKHKTD